MLSSFQVHVHTPEELQMVQEFLTRLHHHRGSIASHIVHTPSPMGGQHASPNHLFMSTEAAAQNRVGNGHAEPAKTLPKKSFDETLSYMRECLNTKGLTTKNFQEIAKKHGASVRETWTPEQCGAIYADLEAFAAGR